MSDFELFLVGFSVVTTVLSVWFRSRLPIHFFTGLRRLGWAPRLGWSCPVSAMVNWTRGDYELWSAVSLPAFWSELLGCPHCLATHISLWTACFLVLLAGAPWYFLIAGTLGWGGLSCFILHKYGH